MADVCKQTGQVVAIAVAGNPGEIGRAKTFSRYRFFVGFKCAKIVHGEQALERPILAGRDAFLAGGDAARLTFLALPIQNKVFFAVDRVKHLPVNFAGGHEVACFQKAQGAGGEVTLQQARFKSSGIASFVRIGNPSPPVDAVEHGRAQCALQAAAGNVSLFAGVAGAFDK